ncbi:MAG: preprotein translocase subunit YajC [Actinomycetes bacterium]
MGANQLLILVLPLVALWFLIIRPAQRRQRDALALRQSLSPGLDVITTSGLIGTLTQVDDDEVSVSVAPGVELRMVKAAIGRVRPAPTEDDAARPD